jgi:hypothetical protein
MVLGRTMEGRKRKTCARKQEKLDETQWGGVI